MKREDPKSQHWNVLQQLPNNTGRERCWEVRCDYCDRKAMMSTREINHDRKKCLCRSGSGNKHQRMLHYGNQTFPLAYWITLYGLNKNSVRARYDQNTGDSEYVLFGKKGAPHMHPVDAKENEKKLAENMIDIKLIIQGGLMTALNKAMDDVFPRMYAETRKPVRQDLSGGDYVLWAESTIYECIDIFGLHDTMDTVKRECYEFPSIAEKVAALDGHIPVDSSTAVVTPLEQMALFSLMPYSIAIAPHELF